MKMIQLGRLSGLLYHSQRGCSLFWAVLLLLSMIALPVRAELPSAADSGVTDSGVAGIAADQRATDDLMQWLSAHKRSGGTYELTGNVDWPGLYVYVEKATVIRMNGYGIRVSPGRGAMMNGPITFIGGQSSVPMFTLEKGAGLGFDEGAKIEVTDGCAIDVKGSCASEGQADCYLSFHFASITAKGENTTAIKIRGDADLRFLQMRLLDGACGIESEGSLGLTLSEIHGDARESLKTGGAVTLDASNVTPWNADALPRSVVPFRQTYVRFLLQGQKDLPKEITIELARDGAEPLLLLRPLHYNEAELPTAAGAYRVNAYPEQLPFDNPAVIFPPIVFNVVVPEPDRYYLQEVMAAERGLYRFRLYPQACEVNAVQVSSDSGSAWETVPHEEGRFDLSHLEPGVHWFRLLLNAPDGMNPVTSIMALEIDENGVTLIDVIGGDRDDSHRDDLLSSGQAGIGAVNTGKGGGNTEKNTANTPDSARQDAAISAPRITQSVPVKQQGEQPPETSVQTGSPATATATATVQPAGEGERTLPAIASAEAVEALDTAAKVQAPRTGLEAGPASDEAAENSVIDEGKAFWVLLLFFSAAAAAGGIYVLLARREKH